MVSWLLRDRQGGIHLDGKRCASCRETIKVATARPGRREHRKPSEMEGDWNDLVMQWTQGSDVPQYPQPGKLEIQDKIGIPDNGK